MTITVGDIYGKFPNFRPEDMIKLCDGNEDLNGRTVVPLANIAAFGDNNLSVFVAEREGKGFTGLLPKNARTTINKDAGIVENTRDKKSEAVNQTNQTIPKDTSIFTMKPETVHDKKAPV